MRASGVLLGALLTVFVLAVPAFAIEDGIIETSSMTPNDDATHADFDRAITNASDEPIDVGPRDLRMAEYPIMTVTQITVGTFDDGIWTVGALEAGQTATIVYSGAASPATKTTTIAPTTTAASAATTTAAPEELPHTGQRDHLPAIALAGLTLIGLGVSLLRATRN